MPDSPFPTLSQLAYRLLDYLSRCPHGDYTPDFPTRIVDEVDIAEFWDKDDVALLRRRRLLSIKDGFVKITPKGRAWLAEAKADGRFSPNGDEANSATPATKPKQGELIAGAGSGRSDRKGEIGAPCKKTF